MAIKTVSTGIKRSIIFWPPLDMARDVIDDTDERVVLTDM